MSHAATAAANTAGSLARLVLQLVPAGSLHFAPLATNPSGPSHKAGSGISSYELVRSVSQMVPYTNICAAVDLVEANKESQSSNSPSMAFAMLLNQTLCSLGHQQQAQLISNYAIWQSITLAQKFPCTKNPTQHNTPSDHQDLAYLGTTGRQCTN